MSRRVGAGCETNMALIADGLCSSMSRAFMTIFLNFIRNLNVSAFKKYTSFFNRLLPRKPVVGFLLGVGTEASPPCYLMSFVYRCDTVLSHTFYSLHFSRRSDIRAGTLNYLKQLGKPTCQVPLLIQTDLF